MMMHESHGHFGHFAIGMANGVQPMEAACPQHTLDIGGQDSGT